MIPKADGAGRFAITKHEVSWGQFNRFCAEFGRCQDGPQDQLPVTGIDLATAADYARWLSGLTGYVYRLPTTGEWQRAAAGVPDPNRNCRIQTAGVQRGLAPVPAASGQANDYGLVNILGNVQEWVLDQERVFALGGAYSDPIEQCISQTVRPHGGAPDAVTGFRLVREVS
jgi:formylglycine-generating enzyme required for sulfatase activity